MLLHEAWLFGGRSGKCLLADVITKGMREARMVAASMLSSDRTQSLDDVRDALVGAQETLVAMDPFFLVEIEFVKSALSDGVAAEVQRRILDTLPSPSGEPKSLADSIAELEELKSSRLGRLCSNSSRGEVETLIGVINKMMRGIEPPGHFRTSTSFYQNCFLSFQNFLVEDVEGDGGAKKRLLGRDVIVFRLLKLKSAISAAKSPEESKKYLADLEALHPFRYLMNAEELGTHAELTKQVVSKGAQASKKSRDKIEVVNKKGQKAKGEGTSSADQPESLMSFF